MNRILTSAVIVCLLLGPVAFGQQPAAEHEEPERPAPVPDVMYVPTPNDVVAKMLELAAVGRDDVVYDLGCGDGRIVVAAARQFGCRALGVDIDPRRVKQARAKVAEDRVEGLVRIEQQDLFRVDLRPATVVTLYLSPKYNTRLASQFAAMRPGSRIVSHQFEIQGAKPDKVLQVTSREDRHVHALYLWTTPLSLRD